MLYFLNPIILLYLVFIIWYLKVCVSDKFGVAYWVSSINKCLKSLYELKVFYVIFSFLTPMAIFLDWWLPRGLPLLYQKTRTAIKSLVIKSIQQQQDISLLLCMEKRLSHRSGLFPFKQLFPGFLGSITFSGLSENFSMN